MKRLFYVVIVMILLTVSGCNKVNVTGEEKIAEDYIKSKGYKITAYQGEILKYTLEKNKLLIMPYRQMWAVQNVEPDNYFGKEITIYAFTVKNHPLQKKDSNAKRGVNLYIMMTENKVIGGYSYPNADVKGSYSSLDGKTLEEIKGSSIQQWMDNWNIKYGSQ
ncbi:MAG: hypothetical protein K0R71_94 [Bacillales bacterium]|jgi:hypothetical protein|nr:hypothetical protein [Bacillales bacterium]